MRPCSFSFVQFSKIILLAAGLAISFPLCAENTPPSDAVKAAREANITHFVDTINLIKNSYAKTVDEKKLLENAIRGMVNNLDPHSEYLDEQAYKALLTTTSGAFGGLGLEVTTEHGVLKIVTPMDDSPAAKAGLKPNDYIVAVNDVLLNTMTSDEAVEKMRGEKGTPVTLTIIRKGEKKPLKFSLIRDTIKTDSLKSKMLNNNIGYIRIGQFQENTAALLTKAINDLNKSAGGNVSGLILDLRNNPGGLLESAVNVVNEFLDSDKITQFKKMIVYTEGRTSESKYEAYATGHDLINKAPLIIMVNAGSASASEIVAGAIQDYRRGIVVGATSFGKGSVQTVVPLDDTHAVKLTTALYHTPSGRLIQNQGIIPDISIPALKIENKDAPLLGNLKESALKDHLKNDTVKETTGDKDANPADLAKEDFQLFETINILKTLALNHPRS
ncbi:MAG: S41 family peptidase [Gammaproteobacteria bacterium]|nr:S41 family peptidase [Gammaproteobacteria bacterium]